MADIKEIIEDENRISTVIADDIDFKGRLVFKDSLKIKGSVEGKIESEGHLIVGIEANVSADITAGIISVNGKVNGKMHATKHIDLFQKSRTHADIVTPDIYIEKGSVFNGTCSMDS
ncbi:MAG: bactofilin family protein [Spirochaetota bacterium]